MPKLMDISRAIDQHLGAVRFDRVVEVSDHDTLLGADREGAQLRPARHG